MIVILTIYKEYQDKVILPMLDINNGILYSNIFFVAKDEISNIESKTIMIIGQNAMHKTKFKNDNLIYQEMSSKCYLEKQLNNVGNDHAYNSSPFWNFTRSFKHEGYNIIWNNIDKINRIKNVEPEDASYEDASYEDELQMNSSYGIKNMSLLQREIEYYNPEILLFVTGPDYSQSMSAALQLDKKVLNDIKPTREKHLVDISLVLDLDILAYWTYHPRYLSLIKLFDETIDTILKSICDN